MKKFKKARKALALLLSFSLVLGMIPASAITAFGAETLVDAAIFCSDVHGSTTDTKSVFGGIATSGLKFSTASFVGDTDASTSSVTSAAQSGLGDTAVECIYAYGSHDSGYVTDTTGILYGDADGENYYVYAISQSDMESSSNASTAAKTFTSEIAELDQTKPLFIISHMPLHARRGDNKGAATWYTAISAAAEEMDIAFFWAHNHTGESSVDTNAYYVAKDGSETMSIQGGSTVTPNFTYMNAGYINANNQSPARKGIATTVAIYNDSMVFQDYNSSGKYTETYAHNVTVAREFASAVEPEVALTSISISGPTKVNYTVGEEFDDSGLVVTAVYSDGSSKKVTDYKIAGYDMATAGEQTVEVSYTEDGVTKTAPFTITVSAAAEETDKTVTDETTSIEVTAPNVTDITVEDVSNSSSVATSLEGILEDGFVAYDIVLEGYTQGELASVTLPIPEGMDASKFAIYYVPTDGTTPYRINGNNNGDGTYTFKTNHFSTYAGGIPVVAEETSGTATVPGSETSTTKKVWQLTDSLTNNGTYLIVNTNAAGSGYALLNNNDSVSAVGVTVVNDGTNTYIELDNDSAEWTATGSGTSWAFGNNGKYLGWTSVDGTGFLGNYSTTNTLAITDSVQNWTLGTNTLYKNLKTGASWGTAQYDDFYLSGGDSWSMSTSSANVYFYTPETITLSTKTEDATYGINITVDDVATAKHTENYVIAGSKLQLDKEFTSTVEGQSPASGGTYTWDKTSDNGVASVDENGLVTFTGKEGSETIKVSYTWTENDVEYTVYNQIVITAELSTYTIEITKNDEIVNDIISIKGITNTTTRELGAIVTYETAENETANVDNPTITWSTSNSAIATVENGTVKFTGKDGSVQITALYMYSDGKSVTDTIEFSVTTTSYIVPSDGTDDFPEYPNQGSIRFDKTATAVGNFSQTGIANVELSMTGVPYGTSTKTDVVVMVDMTASMSDDDVTAAELAVQELIGSLVYDEENDKYDSNIQLFVDTFGSGSSDSAVTITNFHNCTTISNAAELTAAKNAISFSQSSKGGGTRYNIALADVYETLNRDGHADNQFVVFVSDGVATAYSPLTDGAQGTTITGSNSETASLCAGWFDDTGAVTSEFETEYYTYMIKTAGIPVYTVGANLTALSDAADLLNHMSSNYSPDGKTSTGETKYSFFCTTSGGITDAVLEIFHGIGQDIKEAATNVVVEDKIADEYTMNFALPSGVTADEAGMDDFYIQVVGYELDENNERKENPTVIEKFLFNSDGTITHTVGSTTCGDTCTHVTKTDDVVTAIDGTYFDYGSTSDGEFLTWKADKLDRTELALQYFVYLDNSAGNVAAANQVKAGTYPTNEYATLTYTNFNGNECQQYFPVPQMTWNGAQVTYVFYLVNDAGQPVNRAGKVVPFAEAVYVTNPTTYSVTWNDEEGSENMLAEELMAQSKVPDVYSLYDTNAYYEILVYQTEGVDSTTNAKNYNHFIIEGSTSIANKETTKVYNTKAGTRYDDYGAYSATAGTYTSANSNTDYNATVTEGFDYANTTVAFAVVWKPELVEDTVVIDYGLDVVIDVYENDGLAAGVTGVMLDKVDNVEMNQGEYSTAVGKASITSDDGMWTASKESLTSVRFAQNKMEMKDPATFYYEAGVNYYTYDAAGTATLNTTNMYSSVTVIPATTIYYEDDFVTFTNSSKAYDVTDDNGNVTASYGKWEVIGNALTETQDQDRPGESQISETLDADNVYGYDSAYEDMSTYSMGSAHRVKVSSGVSGMASFDFYGTGFDVISMTDNTTGLIIVNVYDKDNNLVKSLTVDTYYGYAKNDKGEWVVSVNNPNALYQVPVMKVAGLEYGKYTAKIVASYNSTFDHNSAKSYDFYLDAIRIYDPTGNTSDVANAAYVKDGEGWPVYQEVRNNVISASDFEAGTINGMVFIDNADATMSVADYESFGPNNELYLDKGQAVVFSLNLDSYSSIVDRIHMGIKSANGGTANYVICDGSALTSKEDLTSAATETVSTTTDMYYDITELKDSVIVVYNAGEEMLSLTNVKITFKENPGTVSDLYYVDYDTIMNVVNSLNTEKFEPTVNIVTPVEVTAGDSIGVSVTTSKDVAAVKINDEIVTTYTVDTAGNFVWSTEIATNVSKENSEVSVKVVAYNSDGASYEAGEKSVKVNAANDVTVVTQTIKDALSSIVNQLKNWFGWS